MPKIVAKITDRRPATPGDGPAARRADRRPNARRSRACFEKLAQANARPDDPAGRRANQPAATGPGRRPAGSAAPAPAPAAVRAAAASASATRRRRSACLRAFATSPRTIVTPEQTIQQLVNPPQTNIESASYSIAGVDPATPDIGLVTPVARLQRPLPLELEATNEALVADSYATGRSLKLGSKIDLNGTKFTVVGPRQASARRPDRGRLPLAREAPEAREPDGPRRTSCSCAPTRAARWPTCRRRSRRSSRTRRSRARRASPTRSAARSPTPRTSRTGSASRWRSSPRSPRSCMAALLTLSSIGKRVREIGTLKALGWTQRRGRPAGRRRVVRPGRCRRPPRRRRSGSRSPPGSARSGRRSARRSTTGGGDEGAFGLGALAARTVTDKVSLTAPISVTVLLVGFGLALAGGLLAGTAGAFRAARLRPADALRTVE